MILLQCNLKEIKSTEDVIMFKITKELLYKIKEKINGKTLEPALADVAFYCSDSCYGRCRDDCDDTCSSECVHDCWGTCKGINSGDSSGDVHGW